MTFNRNKRIIVCFKSFFNLLSVTDLFSFHSARQPLIPLNSFSCHHTLPIFSPSFSEIPSPQINSVFSAGLNSFSRLKFQNFTNLTSRNVSTHPRRPECLQRFCQSFRRRPRDGIFLQSQIFLKHSGVAIGHCSTERSQKAMVE